MSEIINAQNFPRDKRYRRLVIPREPGQVIIEADLSQAEAQVVAWKAKERTLMQKFRDREDIHSFVGSIILEKEVTKKNKEERTVAKRIVHGSDYGMQPAKIVEVLIKELCIAIPVKAATRAQNIYFQNFPRIRTGYQRGIEQELRAGNRMLKTPVGMERKFFAPWGPELYRKAYAHYAQNIVAFITNQAIIKIEETKFGPYILMQGHDAIIMSVPETLVTEARTLLDTVLTYPVAIEGEELVIPVDISVGPNWGEMEEVK